MDLAGDRKLVPVVNTIYAEYDPGLSPDNRWLAYSSDENGNRELYVTSFPGTGSKWQVSNSGIAISSAGNLRVVDWSSDGRNLNYRQGDKIFTVEVRGDANKPEFSAPREVVSIPHDLSLISILADGKRILATRTVGQHSAAPLNLVLNWPHLMQRGSAAED